MPHITVDPEMPGIVGLIRYRPETGRLISELADVLLRDPSDLSRGERELIATYVSGLNDCEFCTSSHAEFAAAQLGGGMSTVDEVLERGPAADVSPKLAALLAIARAVTLVSETVTSELVEAAREVGATDLEVHDTVLIAAVFCMANRYVDGLATLAPQDKSRYAEMAKPIVSQGYLSTMMPELR